MNRTAYQSEIDLYPSLLKINLWASSNSEISSILNINLNKAIQLLTTYCYPYLLFLYLLECLSIIAKLKAPLKGPKLLNSYRYTLPNYPTVTSTNRNPKT